VLNRTEMLRRATPNQFDDRRRSRELTSRSSMGIPSDGYLRITVRNEIGFTLWTREKNSRPPWLYRG